MATTDWVIGRGLLGSALARLAEHPVQRTRVRWSDPELAVEDLAGGLDELIERGGDWRIYWSAGAGVTATPKHILEAEVDVFSRFLERVAALPAEVLARGAFFLASSVGGVYAGNGTPPYSEDSPVAPLSDYGRAKARMEDAVRTTLGGAGLRCVIGRITNLYGPGQNLAKGQGLISVIARTYLTGQPAGVYVSLDTIRDYVYVDDCARVAHACMSRVARASAGSVVTKIIGSSSGTSIGALLGEFHRVLRRRPLVVLGSGNAAGQAPDLRIRSTVWTDLDGLASTTLPAGISLTFGSMLDEQIAPSLALGGE